MLAFARTVAWTMLASGLAVLAAVLPRRHWAALDQWIPVTRSVLLSGIATIAAAAVIGIPAYWKSQEAMSRVVARSLMQAAGWPVRESSGELLPEAAAQVTWLSGYISPLSFALLTPAGLAMTYLAVTGLSRTVAWFVDSSHGDPLLTALDSIVSQRRRARAVRRATAAREALEGPEVPDRLVTGKAAGIPEAELVVVASRRKPEWQRGVFVITPEAWYRIGEPVERQLRAGLRTLYPLSEIHDLEVRRKSVEYDLPPLSGSIAHGKD